MHVTYYYPWGFFHPTRSGADVVARRQLQYLRQRGFRPTIIVRVNNPDESERRAFESEYDWVEEIHEFDTSRHPDVARMFSRWSIGNYLNAHVAMSRVPALQRILSRPADAVFLNYVFSAPLLDVVPRQTKRILESVDLLTTQFHTDENSLARRHLMRTELTLYNVFDAIIMLNAQETAAASQHTSANVVFVPRAVEVAVSEPFEATDRDTFDLLFIGSDHPPNIEALNSFYYNIFQPLLKPQGIYWAIAGSVCRHVGFRDPCVRKLGLVDDLAALYQGSKIVIVPLRQGSGISIKTLEALAHGKPVVASPCGVRGLSDCEACLIKLDFDGAPREVADRIRALLKSRSLRANYSHEAVNFIRRGFSEADYNRKMNELFDAMGLAGNATTHSVTATAIRHSHHRSDRPTRFDHGPRHESALRTDCEPMSP